MSNNRKRIDNASSLITEKPNLSRIEKIVFGISAPEPKSYPYIVLKYYRPDHQCFSEWTKPELKNLSSFIKKLGNATWQDITASGGNNKSGFGYTRHKNVNSLPHCCKSVRDIISEDIQFFELRVSRKSRVHGFKVNEAFFLVLLDRNHAVYPQ
jgi:hypothetical protein